MGKVFGWMSKNIRHPLFLIFLLALVLRLYKLGEFPYGFHADEVRVGWNAYSILKTGADDRGNKFPLYYNTFGDYRPTGIFYVTIPSLIIFGRNEFAVRFPSALLGALTVFPLYLLIKEISKNRKLEISNSSLEIPAALLLAISPWHISVSRATSEVVISLFLSLFGVYFFLKGLKSSSLRHYVFSFLFLAISYFFYHSIRLLAPLYLITIIVHFWPTIKNYWSKKYIMGTLFILLAFTLVLALNKQALGRFTQVSIFNDLDAKYELSRSREEEQAILRTIFTKIFHNEPVIYAKHFLNNYLSYFSGNFLIGYDAKPLRYVTPGIGLLTYGEFLLFLVGLFLSIRKKENSLVFYLLLVAPIPAALTIEDAPNLHRSLFMLPFLLIFESYALAYLARKKLLAKLALVGLALNAVYFVHMYLVHSLIHKPYYQVYKEREPDSPAFRNIGAKELAFDLEKNKQIFEKIVVSNFPDDPYPWYAFFTGKDPKEFNPYALKRELGLWSYQNIVFSNTRCPSDYALQDQKFKVLAVDSWPCPYESKIKDGLKAKIVGKIKRPDSSEVYIFLSN
ncbi:MAG: glycosyltransferase family 39 protein [Patescibacteria group bacterium]